MLKKLKGDDDTNSFLSSPTESSMGNKQYLKKIIDIFSKATDLNVIAVDIDGNIFLSSEEYEQVKFCHCIQKCTSNGFEKCRRTYQKACHESSLWDEPYFFMCHAGLVMWSVPIVINDSLIGSVICGQVLLWKPDELYFDELKQFHSNLSEQEMQKLETEAKKLKVISPERCQASANLLYIIVQYIAQTYDTDFMKQKSLLEWRNIILSRLEKQKKAHEGEKFDYSVYMKRERRFLQALRMADKNKADQLIPFLFTDIEMLSSHHLEEMQQMLEELMVLSSRALMEAGIKPEIVRETIQEYREGRTKCTHSEELFRYAYQMFNRLLDSRYLLLKDREHASIIMEVCKYIDSHYYEKIKVEEIADFVYLSSSYLSSLFRETMNMTIHDYLIRVRIEKSIEFMKDRNLSLKDIIQKCGMESQSYYNKVFKKMIGMTPGKYRNQLL